MRATEAKLVKDAGNLVCVALFRCVSIVDIYRVYNFLCDY